MDSGSGVVRLDYSTVTDKSLSDLSECDTLLLSDISNRCNFGDSSNNAIRESLNLALTFERLSIFKKVLKDSESFVSAAREYSQLVDSLTTDISECREILDISMNRSNSAAETIAKTLEYAEKMALTKLISGEIVDKFNMMESYDSTDILPFEEKIQKLNSRGVKCIDSILLANNVVLETKKYRALVELIKVKNLELDSICESLFVNLRDLIKEYSSGSQTAELFFETIYLKDSDLPFTRSLFVLSHRKTYFNYIVERLIRAKAKRLSQVLSMTRFDSINHFLAFAHELREEDKGFVNTLNYIQQSQQPLLVESSRDVADSAESPLNNTTYDNPLARVLEEKLSAFTTSHHLKALRLLTFYINKYRDEEGPEFFLEIFEKFKVELMGEFGAKIEAMDSEFARETLSELETPGITVCEDIDKLVERFRKSYNGE